MQTARATLRTAGCLVGLLGLLGCVTPGVTRRGGGLETGTLVGGDPERKAVLLQHTDGTLSWLPLADVAAVHHDGQNLWRSGMITAVVGTSIAMLAGLLGPADGGLADDYRIGALFGGTMVATAGGMLIGFGTQQHAVSEAHVRRAMVEKVGPSGSSIWRHEPPEPSTAVPPPAVPSSAP
jgi:hypothetical protein